MKTVKFILFILVAVVLKACGTSTQNNADTDSSFSLFGDSEKTYEFKDPKSGLLVSTANYPSDWKVITKAEYNINPNIPAFRYQIQGPDGMQAFNAPLKLYYAATSRQLEQTMRNAGTKNVKSLMTPQQLVQSEVAPKLQGKGFSFSTTMTFPELERKARKEAAKNVTAAFNLTVNGTVWRNNAGQKALVILNYLKLSQQSSIVWMYSTDMLISNEDQFDSNVATFVKSSLESEPTPEWENHMASLNAQRQEEMRQQNAASNARMQQSAIAHQNRMAQRQASFNAHQQKMQGIWAAQDASHASFMNNNFGSGSTSGGSYGSQQGFVNMIHGEETISHPNGNSYQIESGAKETWMDGDGNPVYSNDLFYNPNTDKALNNTEWTKVWEDY